jgi:hypothetical protein
MHPEEQYALRVLKAGAAGYLTKESVTEELIDAIRKVSKGMKYVSSHMAQEIAFALDSDTERPIHEALSDREFQVLCMIASGKPAREIAEELSLSVKTVSTYRSLLCSESRKVNVNLGVPLLRKGVPEPSAQKQNPKRKPCRMLREEYGPCYKDRKITCAKEPAPAIGLWHGESGFGWRFQVSSYFINIIKIAHGPYL